MSKVLRKYSHGYIGIYIIYNTKFAYEMLNTYINI